MDTSITMTPVQPAAAPGLKAAPRALAATPQSPPAPAAPLSPPPPEVSVPPAPALKAADLEALLERVGEQISEFSAKTGRKLEFQIQDDSRRVVILVKNSTTGDLVRTIPPEEIQRLAEALQSGQPFLFDGRA